MLKHNSRLLASILAILLLIGIILSGCSSHAQSSGDWENQVIYFVMTDRFCDGDTSNDSDVNKADPLAYHGGDLQGIIDKLDYIKKLGATAIWITPVVDNEDGGYHGYWAYDFRKVDEHLGDMAKLKELVNKAHKKGIKVILDMVFNHTGYKSPWLSDPTKNDWFHPKMDIANYNDQQQVENGWLSGLPDLNQSNPEVEKYLLDTAMYWIDNTGIDGFRLDTVRHVPKEFWEKLSKTIKAKYPNFFLLGEVFANDPVYLSGYQDVGINSITNYPLYYAMNDVFAKGESPSKVHNVVQMEGSIFKNTDILGNFIDNHDVPRFLDQAGENGIDKLKAALTYLMTAKGVPIIYYGTEVPLQGGADPDNRRDMDWTQSPQLADYIKKLSDIRLSDEVFTHGEYIPLSNDKAVAFIRSYEEHAAMVVINNKDAETDITLNLPNDISLKERTIRDRLGNAPDIRIEQGKIYLKLGPYESGIYIAGD